MCSFPDLALYTLRSSYELPVHFLEALFHSVLQLLDVFGFAAGVKSLNVLFQPKPHIFYRPQLRGVRWVGVFWRKLDVLLLKQTDRVSHMMRRYQVWPEEVVTVCVVLLQERDQPSSNTLFAIYLPR